MNQAKKEKQRFDNQKLGQQIKEYKPKGKETR